ncbi:DgyrCDS2806 [Dimorphilus gyrociliatus]|uniref:DgyrCDS2806 n=1 Tax=Dimorphilus gyrociliatus TaxID=2664684 RepID=A0A7I8VBC9_9ANNE|nr:DgyrCDS2806 [Dimorphilus gyrociliatus]
MSIKNIIINFICIVMALNIPLIYGDAEGLSDFVSFTNKGPNDVIFIMDRSTSVENTLFYRNNRRLTETLIKNFMPVGNLSRIAAVTFGKDATNDFDYISPANNIQRPTKCELQDDFNKILFKSEDHFAKGFNISGALSLASDALKEGRQNRFNVTQLIVLMSDGDYNKEQDPKTIIEQLENDNVYVFVVGIGWWLEVGNMRTLATKDEYYGDIDQWMDFSESNNSFTYFKNTPTIYQPFITNSQLECNLLKSQTVNISEKIQNVQLQNCSQYSCKNGGKCMKTYDSVICVCPWGFDGVFCETEVNVCQYDTLCENGGICYIHENDRRKGFRCDCKTGTSGYKCSNVKKPSTTKQTEPTTKQTEPTTLKTTERPSNGPIVTEKTTVKDFPYGPVIGSLCGALLLLLIIGLIVIFIVIRRRRVKSGDDKPIIIKKEMMTGTDAIENGLYSNNKVPDKEDPTVPPMRQDSNLDENVYESLETVHTVSEAVYEYDVMYACMKNWQSYIDKLSEHGKIKKAALIKKDFTKQATSKNFLISISEIYQLIDLVENSYDEEAITIQGCEYKLNKGFNNFITGLATDQLTSFAIAQTKFFIVIAIAKYPDQEKNDLKEVEWIYNHVLEEGF